MHFGVEDMTSSLLVQHEAHRQQGHPAISALCGSLGAGISCWRTWCRSSGRAAVVSRGLDPARWSEDYVKAFLRDCDPPGAAQKLLAGRSHGSPLNLSRVTLPQLGRLFEQAAMGDSGADRLCRRVLEAGIANETLTPDRVSAWFHGPGNEAWIDIIGAIVDFLPIGGSPALLVVPVAKPSSELDNDLAVLEKAIQHLAVLISHVPRASVGICAEQALFEHYLKTAPESFSKAVVRESLTPVSTLSSSEIADSVSRRLGRAASEWDRQIEQLANRGAPPELVDRFIEVIESHFANGSEGSTGSDPLTQTGSDTLAADETDPARSSAERFLYTLLESTPDLAGLFELNARPGFDFGGRPAEIDLACLSKRIAVEIDGYHHFTDPSAYRRDRRKDAVLQEHGFFVLRFLAKDVVSEMELICETIRGVVELRE